MKSKERNNIILFTSFAIALVIGFYLWKRNKKGSAFGTADSPSSEILVELETLKNQLKEANEKNDKEQATKIANEIKLKTEEAFKKGLSSVNIGEKAYANQDLNAYFDPQMKKIYRPSFKKGEYIGAYAGVYNNFLSKIKRKRSGIALQASFDTIYVPTSKITRQ